MTRSLFNFFVIFFLLLCSFTLSAQAVRYDYDSGGNRIKRFGLPDLTPAQFFSGLMLKPGDTLDYVIAISNVGYNVTSDIIEFRVTNYPAATGITLLPGSASSVIIDGDDFDLSNAEFDITTEPTRFTITSKPGVVIPPLSYKFIGFKIFRSGGSAGSVNNTVTIIAGTGGGEAPSENNAVAGMIYKL